VASHVVASRAAARNTALDIAIAGVLIAATASCRFLALTGFPDDHYVHLAGAQQMLHGAWPSRDFVDLGAPLTYSMSAAAQALFGQSQLTEAVLMALAFGVGAAVTLRAGVALTGSIVPGLVAAVIEVLIFPRTYSYPKMVIYATAAAAMIWYAARPSPPRMVALALLAVAALLVRHDHGLYVGAAALVAVVLSPAPFDRFRGAASAMVFCASVLLFALPYLIYLWSADGVVGHLQRGMAFTALETTRQRLTIYGLPFHEAWLVAFVWLTPVIAFARASALFIGGSTDAWPTMRRVGPIVALALIADAGLIRDQLEVRLPDAIVAPALLFAWLIAQAWMPQPRLRSTLVRAVCVASVLVTMWSVSVMGRTEEQLDRIGVFNGIARLPERFGERALEMRRPWVGRQAPSAAVRAMQPFFDYVDRCVPAEARLLVPAFLPEVPVLARRAFAGGQVWFMAHALATPHDHALVMQRLARERVPIAVRRRPNYDDLAAEFPDLDRYIASHFTLVAQWSLGGDDRVELLADTTAATSVDRQTGWPCFK
jgi:hypothetical protein